jgi:hypothetical protein
MIVTKINGGLGNQMFQYAAGRSLALRHQANLVLDISALKNSLNGNTARVFELDKYSISARLANSKETSKFYFYSNPIFRRISFLHRPYKYIHENHFHFESRFLQLPNNVYLDGYWQSHLYFQEFSQSIRSELQPLTPPSPKNQALLDEIISCNSIALHIRRGDYVSNFKAAVYHGTCSLEYYQKAITEIIKRIESPRFYIFSDDFEWTKANLKIACPTIYVDQNTNDQSFEDLRLMSHCKHQIIANSSFSWWGAWLNPNPEKIVIGPKQWFLVNKDTSTLFPTQWLRI